MFVGIDMGGTVIRMGLVDNDGDILCRANVPTAGVRDKFGLLDNVLSLCRRFEELAESHNGRVDGVGFGIPGVVDNVAGIARYNLKIPAFCDIEVRKYIHEHFRADVNCQLANNAGAAALAEAVAGAARGSRFSVTMTIGAGLGAGVVVDGRLYTGCNAAGIEIGHMCIVSDGDQCDCGRRGCFEAYVAVPVLVRRIREAAEKNPDSLLGKIATKNGRLRIEARTVFDAARQECPVAKAVIDDYARWLAEGIGNIIVCYQPEIICIGGAISSQGDNLLGPVREHLQKKVYFPTFQRTRLAIAQLGDDAGIIGAALLCR
jgi:glucokinase